MEALGIGLLISIAALLDLVVLLALRDRRTRRRSSAQVVPRASELPPASTSPLTGRPPSAPTAPDSRRMRLTLLACGMLISLLGCGLLWSTEAAVTNLVVLAGGVSLLAGGLEAVAARGRPLPAWSWIDGLARRLEISPAQLLMLVVGLLLTLGARSAAGDHEWASYPWYWILWLAGITLTVAGCWSGPLRSRLALEPLDLFLATALAGLALAVRLLELEYLPYILRGDEGAVGSAGLAFLQRRSDNALVTGWYQFPSFYFWIIAVSQSLLGRTAAAIRLVSALAGTGAVLATYAWTRSMFGRLTGLLAGLVLACLDLHVLFSRVGLNNVIDTFTLTLSMAALWAAWKTGERRYFILLGVGVGLSPFFYASGRLVPVLVFASLLLMRRQWTRSSLWPGALAAAVVGLSICLPLALFYVDNPLSWAAPLARVALDLRGPVTLGGVLHQAVFTALGIVSQPMIGFYVPGAPMLLPAQAALFLCGIALCLARWRDPRSSVLLLGLGSALATGAFSVDAPNSQRLLFATPYCAILCALPLGELANVVRRRLPTRVTLAAAAAVLLVLSLAALNLNRLLFWALPRHAYWDAPAEVGTLAGRYLAALPHPLRAYFLVDVWIDHRSIGQLPYLAGEVDWVDLKAPILRSEDIPSLVPPSVVMALPSRFAELEFIRQATPGSEIVDGIGDTGTAVYRILEVLR